ncbi:SLC13 family permease [Homoserinibacter sp. YIM 151385]|uniref:SLC13 family permease n=1 Tax=Homoserinibacter sp. YIM 151385 TaxID=2985506 RepID=UPI0022EFD93B|nr:SLC13 family permease [Homoserinibacter sp. YIM 151385]WBU39297.1 ArsB/NhaD family transporter [Homoserinibacter sp. YIM 151385]
MSSTGVIGGVLLLAGGAAILTGLLPMADAVAVLERTWPILLFVVAITVVTELAAEAGLFSAIAERMARLGRGRALVLWLHVVVFAVLGTVFLSLDTTAVLLTPVVVLLARHNGLPPLPFALTTVWLANTGSLLLPVANLTNLLAEHALGFSDPLRFASLMALPALVAVLVPCLAIALVFRRELALRFEPAAPPPPEDRVLFRVSAVVVALIVPGLVSGAPVWIPAVAGALVLLAVFAVRRRRVIRFSLVPWQLVLLAGGLFLVVETAHARGLAAALAGLVGEGGDAGALLRLAGLGAAGANAIDNLPAYLALEPLAEGDPARVAALLVGVNAGPLVTPWASLATLLWHERLVSLGVELSWRRYALLGLLVAPPTVALATLAILL